MATGDDIPIFVSTSESARVASLVARAILLAAAALAVGVATSYGQGWLHGTANALVNSESVWLVAPLAAGACVCARRAAAFAGLCVCVLQLVGYDVCSALRFHDVAWAGSMRWAVAAFAGGPLFGLAGWVWRFGRPGVRGIGPAALAAAFATEGAWQYLRESRDTGAGVLWLAIAVGICWVAMRGWRMWAWLVPTVAVGLFVQLAVTAAFA